MMQSFILDESDALVGDLCLCTELLVEFAGVLVGFRFIFWVILDQAELFTMYEAKISKIAKGASVTP